MDSEASALVVGSRFLPSAIGHRRRGVIETHMHKCIDQICTDALIKYAPMHILTSSRLHGPAKNESLQPHRNPSSTPQVANEARQARELSPRKRIYAQ